MTAMRSTALRIVLWIVALTSLELGVWASFWPRQFFTTFPGGGRTWVAVNGPYNEHFIRDFGGLNLALAALFIVAAVTLSTLLIRTAAVSYVLFALPHFVYHARHLDVYSAAGDKVANMATLGLSVVLPLAALALTMSASSRAPAPARAQSA
jgi:hypothetical protein